MAWLPPVNIPSVGAGDYSRQLFGTLDGVGEAFRQNRRDKIADQQWQGEYSARLDAQRFNQADADRRYAQGVRDSDRQYSLGVRGLDLRAAEAAKPTPYSDVAKFQSDLANGLITQEQYDQASRQVGQPDPASISNITALRKDYESGKGTNRYREAAPILASMIKSVSDITSMADLDFVYGMAKIFDPTSVVRESEMGLVIDSQSMPAQLKGQLEKILNGEAVLQPQSRQDLVRAASTRVNEYYTQAQAEAEDFTGIAERLNIDPRNVVRPLEAMPSFGPAGGGRQPLYTSPAGEAVFPLED